MKPELTPVTPRDRLSADSKHSLATSAADAATAQEPPQLVSIVVPCRNELRFIGKCLDSIVAQDYPKDRTEVLVVDGLSDDGTRTIIEEYAARHSFIRRLDNPARITPAALNIGVMQAHGSVIMLLGAHSSCPPNYVSGLVRRLEASGADAVGGVLVTLPANETALSHAIAAAMSHPFGVGNAYFRTGVSEPRWVDTVPFGCYRREVFERIGMFDEELARNQDDEFNLRLLKHGGQILLVPEIVSSYYARESLSKLWRMYYQYGLFKPLVIRKIGKVMTARQVVPALFVLTTSLLALTAPWFLIARIGLSFLILVYIAAVAACSTVIGVRKGFRCGLAICTVFPTLHLSYGFGFLKGMAYFLLLRRGRSPKDAEIPITR